ncbi:MAG: 30S ribosomal protein S6 [Desulfobacterales bacterium]
MRRYETIMIMDSELSEESRKPVFDRVTGLISDKNGMTVLVDEWGSRRLAYEIKKRTRGYYVRFDYCGSGSLVDEIERFCRIDDRILKYMTVLIDEKADPAEIQKEIDEAGEKAAASSAEATDQAEAEAEAQKTEPASEAPSTASEASQTDERMSAAGEEVPNE